MMYAYTNGKMFGRDLQRLNGVFYWCGKVDGVDSVLISNRYIVFSQLDVIRLTVIIRDLFAPMEKFCIRDPKTGFFETYDKIVEHHFFKFSFENIQADKVYNVYSLSFQQ